MALLLLLLAACTGQSAVETEPPTPMPEPPNATAPPPANEEEEPPDPYAPGKGDELMQREEVTIHSLDILVLESYPPQFRLQVTGSLPTPCHQLRTVVDEPNEQNQIHVQIYSLVDPQTACTQIEEPFAISLSLGRDFRGDLYTVFVNDKEVGEINSH